MAYKDKEILKEHEALVTKKMTKAMDFSVEQRKQLLQLLETGTIKVQPLLGDKDTNIGYINYLDKELFVKKAREDRSQRSGSSLDLYLRPDLLLKYKKLLHNEIFTIQQGRGIKKTFYKVKFPDIAAVNQKYLVTETLPSGQLDLLQKNEKLMKFILTYIGDSFDSIPEKFWGAIGKYQDGKKDYLDGRDLAWYLHFKEAMDRIHFRNHEGEVDICFTNLGKVTYNKHTKGIVFVSPKLKNLIVGRNQFIADQYDAFRKLFEKRHIGNMDRLNNDDLNDFRFFVKEKEGKIYKITNDSVARNMMFGGRTKDKKPIFAVSDDLWIQESTGKDVD